MRQLVKSETKKEGKSLEIPYKACWAKTDVEGRPSVGITAHGLTAGSVAAKILENHPLKRRLRLGVIASACHDVGKIWTGFLHKSKTWLLKHGTEDLAKEERWEATEPHFHADCSQVACQNFWKDENLAEVIGAHHGKTRRPPTDWYEPQKAWAEKERKSYVKRMEAVFGKPKGTVSPGDKTLLKGLVAVADWVASSDLCLQKWELTATEAKETAAKALADLGWGPPPKSQAWDEVFKFPVLSPGQNLIVKTISERCTMILEDQTGNGKTEAALMAANILWKNGEAQGLYFALPTTLTSDMIYTRVEEWLRNSIRGSGQHLKLCHSKSWMTEGSLKRIWDGDNADQSYGTSWFNSPRKSLLAHVGVGTIDQALLGTVSCTHSPVRIYGLAGKVVILDEIHSYDAYTNCLIAKLIKTLEDAGASVIILSATLTHAQKEKLLGKEFPRADGFPLLTVKTREMIQTIAGEASGRGRTVQIRRTEEKDAERLWDECVKRAETGECVLIVMNTVDKAQEIWRKVRARTKRTIPVGLLHSRFVWKDRKRIEETWTKDLGKSGPRPKGAILIGTQILEQSLDIDSDFLVTELAPIDFLIQRLGRLWRHERGTRPCRTPEAVILGPSELPEEAEQAKLWKESLGKSAWVYEPYLLWRTMSVIGKLDKIQIPEDTREVLEECYREQSEEEAAAYWKEKSEEKRRKMEEKAYAASNQEGIDPIDDKWEGLTRYGISNATVVLGKERGGRIEFPNGESVETEEWTPETARKLHDWAVSVQFYRMVGQERSKDAGRFFPDGAYLLEMNPLTGEITTPMGKFEMKYTKEQGLIITKR